VARSISLMLLAALPLALGSCDRDDAGGNNAAANIQAGNASSDSGNGTASEEDRVLSSETVRAKFAGFQGGHELSAKLKIAGRRGVSIVEVGSAPVAAFLNGHKGATMKVRLDKVSRASQVKPETDPRETVVKVASAQIGAATSDAYWRTLSQKQRDGAEASLSGILAFPDDRLAARRRGDRG